MNWIDILIVALIILALAAAIIGIVKKKKCGCGGCCEGCPMSCKHRK